MKRKHFDPKEYAFEHSKQRLKESWIGSKAVWTTHRINWRWKI